jgi:hypothetical protein
LALPLLSLLAPSSVRVPVLEWHMPPHLLLPQPQRSFAGSRAG